MLITESARLTMPLQSKHRLVDILLALTEPEVTGTGSRFSGEESNRRWTIAGPLSKLKAFSG